MERVNMIATTALKYAGKKLAPGDAFTAPRAHARAFHAIKRATYATKDQATIPAASATPVAPVPAHEPAPVEAPAESPTYETAQMEAESPQVPAEDSKTKRTYKRRDLTPKS